MTRTQIPQQPRSIAKKERIIESGINLMRTKGYYHVTTIDIAKSAGVSTGICYRYFQNKLEILTAALNTIMYNTFHSLTEELLNMPSPISKPIFANFIKLLLDRLCEMHKSLGVLHNDLVALQHSEPEIAHVLEKIETQLAEQFIAIFQKSETNIQHPIEKLYITYTLLEGYCHKKFFSHGNSINLDLLYDETITTIMDLIFPEERIS